VHLARSNTVDTFSCGRYLATVVERDARAHTHTHTPRTPQPHTHFISTASTSGSIIYSRYALTNNMQAFITTWLLLSCIVGRLSVNAQGKQGIGYLVPTKMCFAVVDTCPNVAPALTGSAYSARARTHYMHRYLPRRRRVADGGGGERYATAVRHRPSGSHVRCERFNRCTRILIIVAGNWMPVDVSHCYAFTNSRCDDHRTCLNNSVCIANQNLSLCGCRMPYQPVDATSGPAATVCALGTCMPFYYHCKDPLPRNPSAP
jgi:hypothetical protein